MKYNKTEIKEAVEFLKPLQGKHLYCRVVSVSKSGMSRRLEFSVVQNDQIVNVTLQIATITGLPYDYTKGLKIDGCGMDMRFACISNLNYAMATTLTGKSIKELLESKECGEHIYDKFFFNANQMSEY